jgi:AGZA family xanthine/uracil permease-like MFS transporter
MMMRQVVLINWKYIGDALPAFVTLMFMPFSYSVAYGLIAGLLTYAVINTMTYLTTKLTGGRIVPVDEEHREYWTYKPSGTLPWFIRAAQDPHGFFTLSEPRRASEVPSQGSVGSIYETAHKGGVREKDLEQVVTHGLPRTVPEAYPRSIPDYPRSIPEAYPRPSPEAYR